MQSKPNCGKIKTNRKRVLCPACGRHTVAWMLPTTVIKDMPVKCNRCGSESVLNISFVPEPDVPVP